MVTTPVERKRCKLCLAILEITHISYEGHVTRVGSAERHTPEECARATEARIRVLEEVHQRDARELETQSRLIAIFGQWIGVSSQLLDAGEKWLEHRAKRVADIARLRGAFSTGDRSLQHPLWQSEEELATKIAEALDLVKKRSTS